VAKLSHYWHSHITLLLCDNLFVGATCLVQIKLTRSQAVARIADRTASQHLRGSCDVIGHVTISYWWSTGTESLNPAVFEILGSKHIEVMSLTVQGHVTLLVT